MRKQPSNHPTHTGPHSTLYKAYTAGLILSALCSTSHHASAQILEGTTTQKQAIELLKSQGKILPNIPNDYRIFGANYTQKKTFYYNQYPFGKRQRYEAQNLKDVDGKNIEIDNDIDSCNFFNETIYKHNLDKIKLCIIDSQIDTTKGAGMQEYERIDRAKSKNYSGLDRFDNAPAGHIPHMNEMLDVVIAKKDNFTEENRDQGYDEGRRGRENVGIRPGKARIYSVYAAWGISENYSRKAVEDIYNEAKINPDKKYILSFSQAGGMHETVKEYWTKLHELPNTIIFVARNHTMFAENPTATMAYHPATIEVGYVTTPFSMVLKDITTLKYGFGGPEKDLVVDKTSLQTGEMLGDGFCVLDAFTTSQATAFLSGLVANIRNQNPNWTRDQIMDMLKKSCYKSSEYQDNENGRNPWTGYGVVQPRKIMSENIFPQLESKGTGQGKYYFSVPNYPNQDYTIDGPGVQKDQQGYYIDLSKVNPGNHTYTFWAQCPYEGKMYTVPINRTMKIVGPEIPGVSNISEKRRYADANHIYFELLKGKIDNYKPEYQVTLIFNDGVKIENIAVNTDGTFDLTNGKNYPIAYKSGDPKVKMTVQYKDSNGNISIKEITLTTDIVATMPEVPMVSNISGKRKYMETDANYIYFEFLKAKIDNYKPEYQVTLIFNDGVKIENIVVNTDGTFNLSNTTNYPIAYKIGDPNIKMVVQYKNSEGNISTKEVILTPDIVTDIPELSNTGGMDNIKVYPNPVRDIVNIDIPSDVGELQVKIFTATGQLYSIDKVDTDNKRIDMSGLTPGIYFITVINKQGHKKTEKIIKQ